MCGVQYVGQTKRSLKTRFREHCSKIKQKKGLKNYLYQHFRNTGHSVNNLFIQPVEKVMYNINDSITIKTKIRHEHELQWIKLLQTPYPLGLNDNIHHLGNISRDPTIDIFNLCVKRIRKSRSHGIRKNRNIKRKSRKIVSVSDLNTILKNSGRHSMLSYLTNLHISSLKKLDQESDRIIFRNHPLYQVACLIQRYTQHFLKPHIDSEEDHKRYFLKIQFLNKGIDLINLPSIFKDRNVSKHIPKYFNNSESPMICYKYNKPVRNILFNYNQLVSDFEVESNTPSSCNCSDSKYCYQPAGHIITGNFDLIHDQQLKRVFSKGPKYRLPSPVDFDVCLTEITHSLDEFSTKWCKKEDADPNALNNWKKAIMSIISTRIKFYQSNPHLLPPQPKVSVHALKHSLKQFHSNFVLVPADKAANNIIIV